MSISGEVMWSPSRRQVETSELTAFIQRARPDIAPTDYAALHHWSITEPAAFWSAVWDYGAVIGERRGPALVHGERMPGAEWFPEARLNYAENLLRYRDEADALVFRGEDRVYRTLSHNALYREVAALAAALKAAGIAPGDRVAAWLPNMPETVITLLAAAALGAVFSSASPDFGVQGVLDRFGQVNPRILVAADGYWHNGKRIDTLARLGEISAGLPSLERVLVVPYLARRAGPDISAVRNGIALADFVADYRAIERIEFARLPFAHPLLILYSSGTTGMPKSIIHSAGGTLLQHIKEHRLHTDLRQGDRLFYYTTCGWMMWNWLVSGLASGAALLLYDGHPFGAEGNILWDYAAEERMTQFGTSAQYLAACARAGLRPAKSHALGALRAILSTGSPLAPRTFDYVYRDIKQDVQLASISGGTDIVSCFVLGNPNGPVRRGEIQCRGLGMAVEVRAGAGRAAAGEKGELVCARPFPSMPLGFWNDPDNARYESAYFRRFPNVWCQGDYSELTADGGVIIHGRSDATLNPGGVRIGTAEIYRQVEKLPEVLESVAVGQQWHGDLRIILFVKLSAGLALDEALIKRIKQTLREHASPRHVPARVLQVADIPRTQSGKIAELAVRAIIHGEPVKNTEALANPEALEHFRRLSGLGD